MTFTVRVSGFRELEKALAELPKSVAKATLVRTLKKAAEPLVEAAKAAVPVDKGVLRDSIKASVRLKNKVGSSEFAAAMRGGLGKAAAVSALRDARRAAKGKGSFAVLYVGPSSGKGAIRYAHIKEFGSVDHAPEPYMRPAWDAQQNRMLSIIRAELASEIMAAARRVGRAKRYSAEVKSRASVAARLAQNVD